MHCFLGQHFSKNILLALHIQHVTPGKLHASKAVATTIQLLLHTPQPNSSFCTSHPNSSFCTLHPNSSFCTSHPNSSFCTSHPFKQRWEKKLGRRVLASRDTGPKGAVRKAVAAPGNAFGRWLSRLLLQESTSDDAAPGKNLCGEATSGQAIATTC